MMKGYFAKFLTLGPCGRIRSRIAVRRSRLGGEVLLKVTLARAGGEAET
jgi:hypothetical protein